MANFARRIHRQSGFRRALSDDRTKRGCRRLEEFVRNMCDADSITNPKVAPRFGH